MHCPHCPDAVLSPLQYEGITIQTCGGCGGEFLSSEQMGHVVRTREQRFEDQVHANVAGREPITGVPSDEHERGVSCPACDQPMIAVNYANDSGIHVDRCNVCGGIWLDPEELENVQALLERQADEVPARIQAIAGDIEQARADMAERSSNVFEGSRFAFVNAVINRILDAA